MIVVELEDKANEDLCTDEIVARGKLKDVKDGSNKKYIFAYMINPFDPED